MDSEQIGEIAKLFHEAEAKLKLIERLHSQELVVPSVNELRYAGFHVIQGLTSSSAADQMEHWQKARNHCKRAIYDALEVGVLDRLEAFKQFEEDYRLVEIPKIISNYIELRKTAREAQHLIAQLETPESRQDRDNYYKNIEEQFAKLCDAVDTLIDARPELNKLLRDRRINFTITVAGAIASIIAAIFAWLALP